MNSEVFEKCDFNDPASVVAAFIGDMNNWEVASWKASRAARGTPDPASYQKEVLQNMNEIFDHYCTKKERKYGRLGSFQKPPQYDPLSEKIVSSTIDEKLTKAIVETMREAVLGGKYRYILYRKDNKWLIDNLKHERSGKWERAIL